MTVILQLVCTLKTPKITQTEPSQDVLNFRPEISKIADLPKTVDEAVDFLISNLSLKDKSTIAKMSEKDLNNLQFSLGLYVRRRLLYLKNDNLLESCRQKAKDKSLHLDQAPRLIIKELWKQLRESHKLRVVKE